MNTSSVESRIQFIFSLYEKYGANEYHGEEVSQIEHMCQSGELAFHTKGY